MNNSLTAAQYFFSEITVNNNDYPSIEEAYRILKSQDILDNVLAHCEKVMKVTHVICCNLNQSLNINQNLAEVSALLHDVTKSRSIKTREAHAETGSDLLLSLGYPRVADIILKHVFLDKFDPDKPLTEAEIVHYSDKRVKHHEVVTLDKRIEDLLHRYGQKTKSREIILSNIAFMQQLEKKVRNNLIKDIEKDLFLLNEK